MNDLFNDPKAIALWLLGSLMSLMAWIGNKHVKRLEALEGTAVRKDELAQLRTDMERRHGENTAKLDNIDEGITGTHRRIDDLYRDLIGRSDGR